MVVNATLINLYNVCPRECWLHANGIRMEHTSGVVAEGKLLHETSYPQRAEKHAEIALSGNYSQIILNGKVDFYDAHTKTVHEIKRSNKVETAHEWQAKFYLWLLALNGIHDAIATLEYPSLRQTSHVKLKSEDILHLQMLVVKISNLIESEDCPPVISANICKSCSYYELCYIREL